MPKAFERVVMNTVPATMRAAVIDAYGGPEVIRIDTQPVPSPGPKQVLIKVRFAGVNIIDCKTRADHGITIDTFPAGLGWDLSGTVASIGSEVTDFWPRLRWRSIGIGRELNANYEPRPPQMSEHHRLVDPVSQSIQSLSACAAILDFAS